MMMNSRKAMAAALAGLLALSGCSSKGEGEGSAVLSAGSQVFGAIKAGVGRGERPPFVNVTKEQLEKTKVPALQVNVLSRGGTDFLRLIADGTDDTPGRLRVWRGSDGTQLVLRDGIVVGTRGIGGDIISADASATAQAVRGARAGNGERRYFISNGDFSDTEVILSCDIDNLGRETTQVVHLTYTTVHLRETCIGGQGDRVRIENDYWVQPGSGVVRRSKQWVGPLTGYFELILLRN